MILLLSVPINIFIVNRISPKLSSLFTQSSKVGNSHILLTYWCLGKYLPNFLLIRTQIHVKLNMKYEQLLQYAAVLQNYQ